MGFTQIIEFETNRIDEMNKLMKDWQEHAPGTPNTRGQICKDREKKNTYLVIAEFPSYEEAMKNSNDPETQQYAEQMGKLCSKAPTFRNLDQQETWQN